MHGVATGKRYTANGFNLRVRQASIWLNWAEPRSRVGAKPRGLRWRPFSEAGGEAAWAAAASMPLKRALVGFSNSPKSTRRERVLGDGHFTTDSGRRPQSEVIMGPAEDCEVTSRICPERLAFVSR